MGYTPPIFFLGLKNLISTIVVYMLVKLRGVKYPSKNMLKFFFLISIMFVIDQVFWISGLNLVSPGESVILFYTYPFMVALSSYLVVREALVPSKLLGIGLGFLGVVTFSIGNSHFMLNPIGYVFMLIAASGWSLNLDFTTKWCQDTDSRMLSFINLTVSTSVLLLSSIFVERIEVVTTFRAEVFFALFYGGLGDVLALIAWFKLTKHWEPTRMATYAFLTPLLTVILSWLILDQSLEVSQIAAMAIIFAGIILVNPPKPENSSDTIL